MFPAFFSRVILLAHSCPLEKRNTIQQNRGIPVSTTIGFCLTLLPLLSMDFETIFGGRDDHFIRRVPESELSTPEAYLESIRSPSPPADSRTDKYYIDDMKKSMIPDDEGDEDDEEEGMESAIAVTLDSDDKDDIGVDIEAPRLTNEETPLLSRNSSWLDNIVY